MVRPNIYTTQSSAGFSEGTVQWVVRSATVLQACFKIMVIATLKSDRVLVCLESAQQVFPAPDNNAAAHMEGGLPQRAPAQDDFPHHVLAFAALY
uniref:Uncharacterized protein n=1 Tax=Steinernema glaseri TaxID=37863 RepID=A0A1I7YGX3_9BILA